MVMRRITPEKLAAALSKKPQVFADARGCAANLPEIRTRLVAATDRLAQLYPAAKFPPITIAIGRATTAGTANRSEEHTSELQSLMRISYAVFCLKKKKNKTTNTQNNE